MLHKNVKVVRFPLMTRKKNIQKGQGRGSDSTTYPQQFLVHDLDGHFVAREVMVSQLDLGKTSYSTTQQCQGKHRSGVQ